MEILLGIVVLIFVCIIFCRFIDVLFPDKSSRIKEKSWKGCPYCGEEIQAVTIKCRYCGEFFDEQNDNIGIEIRNLYGVNHCAVAGFIYGIESFFLGINISSLPLLAIIFSLIGLLNKKVKQPDGRKSYAWLGLIFGAAILWRAVVWRMDPDLSKQVLGIGLLLDQTMGWVVICCLLLPYPVARFLLKDLTESK